MKKRIAEAAGLEKDPAAREKAGHHFKRVIDILNLWDRWSFTREQSTDDSFIVGQQTVPMDNDTYVPLRLELVNNDGDVKHVLERVRWESLKGEEGDSGRPKKFSLLNPYEDRNYYWWPWPRDEDVADYKVRQTFYKRLDRPSGDGDQLSAPREVSAICEIGAQFRFARIHRPNHVALWGSLGREFRELLNRLTWRDEVDDSMDEAWSFGPQVDRDGGDISFLQAFWMD